MQASCVSNDFVNFFISLHKIPYKKDFNYLRKFKNVKSLFTGSSNALKFTDDLQYMSIPQI